MKNKRAFIKQLILPLIVLVGCCLAASTPKRESAVNSATFGVGVGRQDVTGPVTQVNLMGYANMAQSAAGLHTRLWARVPQANANRCIAGVAFVIEAGGKRIVYVNVDIGMISHMLKHAVIQGLQSKYGEELYSYENVCLTATHTHSAPGGYFEYALYQFTNYGVVSEVLEAIANGIVDAISAAHESLAPASIYQSEGEVLDANINRSAPAYMANPPEERAMYKYNVDKIMTLLRFTSQAGGKSTAAKHLGSINWFPVHCTSLDRNNQLISGDNKGYAEYLFEKKMKASGHESFISAFSQSNEGDVSPNIIGSFCIGTNARCDPADINCCGGKVDQCHGRGPAHEKDQFESAKIIGKRQFEAAQRLFQDSLQSSPLEATVDYRHAFINMEKYRVSDYGVDDSDELSMFSSYRTCPAALGYSFAAGTTDGPGYFDIIQGETRASHWLLEKLTLLVSWPTDEQRICHHPKPILLNVGAMKTPYAWVPSVVAIQLLRVGSLYIAAVPAEFTTMAGRRLRLAIEAALKKAGVTDPINVVIAGLSNAYSSYVTTKEEYDMQRYEAASTLYGPNTLDAYIDAFEKLALSMQTGALALVSEDAPNVTARASYKLQPAPLFDVRYPLYPFGTVLVDCKAEYVAGEESVSVVFLGSNPRNHAGAMTEDELRSSYFTIERYDEEQGSWIVERDDNDWDTFLKWKLWAKITLVSHITVEWMISSDAREGEYRIVYRGEHRTLLHQMTGQVSSPHEGISSTFRVLHSTKDLGETGGPVDRAAGKEEKRAFILPRFSAEDKFFSDRNAPMP